MQKKVQTKNFSREVVHGVNVNPVRTCNLIEGLRDLYETNVILGMEMPIIYNKNEKSKNDISDLKGVREFYAFESSQAHHMWLGNKPNSYYFNEYIKGGDQVRLVFDYDIKKSEETLFDWEDTCNDHNEMALTHIVDVMDKLCNLIDPENDVDYTICSSCREDKISYHVIFPEVSIKFSLIPNIIDNFIAKLNINDRDYIFKPDGTTWFDKSIYPTHDGSIKSLRLVGHAKRCNDVKMFPIKGEVTDPSKLYLRHRSKLTYEIIQVSDKLFIGTNPICECNKSNTITRVSKYPNRAKIDKDQLKSILDHLHEARRKYVFRINVMYGIYNTCGEDGKDLYIDFMTNGEMDRSGKARNDWAGIKDTDRERKCTLGTILHYLEEDNLDFRNEIRKSFKYDPILLFHDIGYKDLTYDRMYDELATTIYVEDEENNINEMHRVFYLIKACIAMYKTPETYYRLKRVQRLSTDEEVIYQNTKKLDKQLIVRKEVWSRHPKTNERISKVEQFSLEKFILNGVKLGIMHDFITFYPSIEKTRDLNTFTGFIGSIRDNKKDTDITPVVDHIKVVICKNDEKIFEYFINWLTHIIQKPWQKTDVAPILIGEQGVGKSILFENLIIPYVIGSRYCKTIDNVGILKNKHFSLAETLLLRFEEALFAGDREASSMLKQKITGKSHIVDDKFKDIREVESFLNVVIISNNEHCIHIDVGDRRYLMLECDSVHKCDTEYFDKLSQLFTPEGGHAFYKYLMSRTLHFIGRPPTTKLKEDVINMGKDGLTRFIDEAKSGELEGFDKIDKRGVPHYMFSAEEILRRIDDKYMTKPKMKKELEKNGWRYDREYTYNGNGVKAQLYRWTHPIPNDVIHDARLQNV